MKKNQAKKKFLMLQKKFQVLNQMKNIKALKSKVIQLLKRLFLVKYLILNLQKKQKK